MIPASPFKRIVIAGGGFGGMLLAKSLRNKPFQVVLVDKNNYHTFQPLLYQVATGGLEPDSIAFPLRKVFHKAGNVIFRMADIKSVDVNKNKLITSIGEIDFDYLVVATGSTSNFFNNIEIERNSMTLKSVTDALNIRSLLLQNLESALVASAEERKSLLNVVIVGAGPTGVEVAGALAELSRHVIPNDYPELNAEKINIYLVESDTKVLGAMSTDASSKALQFLKQLGVQTLLNVRLSSYNGLDAVLSDNSVIPAKLLIWSAGVKGKGLEGIPESSIKPGARIDVDEFCRIKDLSNIYAIGDVAMMITDKYPRGFPMVAPVAMQQAQLLAENFLLTKEGQQPRKFKYNDQGSMATVGRNKAVVDLSFVKFQGVFAWFTWMAVHLMSLVGFRNKAIVFVNWVWNYFSYDRAVRLIIRPFKSK